MMRLLIIGGTGLVGGKLRQRLTGQFELMATFSTRKQEGLRHLDITQPDKLSHLFNEFKPEVVIHTAALTHVDYCEEAKDLAWQINVVGVENVVQACRLNGAKLVFTSTEYIFDGQNGPYSEEDTPCPICWYGQTKLEGERLIQSHLNDYLIIRTTVVFGFDLNSKNFIMQMLNNYKNNQSMRIPIDQYSNPTLADNLSEAINELIIKDKRGIYNIVGSTLISRYDFSLKAAEILKLDQRLLIPVKTEDLHQKAKRPKRAGLKITRASEELQTHLYSVEESLRVLKSQITCLLPSC